MHLSRKDQIKNPFINATGETIYEMIGRPPEQGGAEKHSLGYVVLPPSCNSSPHYHPVAEETYFILKGEAHLQIDDRLLQLRPGDTVLIHPNERHQIFNSGESDLEFIAVCAPAWEPSNSIYLDE
jgi:mannose-6-phosphate isomerase-like protein (cupin superfamily)